MPGLGRVQYWDVRNEKFPLDVSLLSRARLAIARSLGIADPRNWRQWRRYFQRQTPRCTAFGTATQVAADPIHQTTGWLDRTFTEAGLEQLYQDIRAEDRRNGRVFDEGGTTLAAMEVGKARGWWNRYEWATSFEALRTWVHNSASIVVGSNWYASSWDVNAENICPMPKPGEPPAGGHLYVLRGYDPKRDLFTHPTTWNMGDIKMPGELVRRLIAEDGEAAFPYEVKLSP